MSNKVDDIESKSENVELKQIHSNNVAREIPNSEINETSSPASGILSEESNSSKPLLEEDFEPLPINLNLFSTYIEKFLNILSKVYNERKLIIWSIIGVIVLIAYIALFVRFIICKTNKNELWKEEPNIRFVWISCLIFLYVLYRVIRAFLDHFNVHPFSSIKLPFWWDRFTGILFYVICGILTALIVAYVIYAAVKYDPYNLVSLAGIISLLSISFVFSTAPHMIKWRPVLVALLIQFCFAWLIMTTKPGYAVFKFLGDRVSEFLNNVESGVIFVFGKTFYQHYFAFRILPIIMFMSSVTAILYYLGIIQSIVISLGHVMQLLIGTTCGESMNAVANIFLGMTEAPLLIRPLLGRMTNSELFAVMTGGFATIAGSVLASYIKYGAPANHLISASVMSAPAALAIAKLMYPETKKSKTTKDDTKLMPKCPYTNVVEAATIGAMDSLPIVGSILATVICFLSILSFFNTILSFIGNMACLEYPLSFEMICSYLFWPLALFMGVKIEDCRKVAELIGVKTFLNEFIAYEKFVVMEKNKKIIESVQSLASKIVYDIHQVQITYMNGTTVNLPGGAFQAERSKVIVTYALCGFANIGSMGILLSAFSTLIPHRRRDLTQMVMRAMVAGNIACFLTASIAGLFYSTERL